MRNIKIVADSCCDLFALDSVPFASTPLKIITSEREFVDDERLNVPEMVDYLAGYKGKSKSSCPNTAEWINAFGDADEVFCVTITGGLSGSYNSACVAKGIYESENKGKKVFVLDSLSAGPEVTMAVKKLEELILQELSFEEIAEQISCYIKKTGLLFMLKSLKTFANNGRVSPVVARIAGIAGICIVGKASDEGTLEPLHKCRGEKKSLDAVVSELAKAGLRSGKVSIGHSQNEAGAENLRQLILAKFPKAEVEIHKMNGLCCFYAEKGGILVGYEKM